MKFIQHNYSVVADILNALQGVISNSGTIGDSSLLYEPNSFGLNN